MTHLRIRVESYDGRVAEVSAKAVRPFTAHDLLSLNADARHQVHMELLGFEAVVDGVPVNDEQVVRTSVRFRHSPAPYALVQGGWLPLPFVIPQRFLVDRNVVSSLRKLRDDIPRAGLADLRWWTSLFKGGNGIFNPLPYAFEGSARRKPTFAEFVASYMEGVAELKSALPRATIISYEESHFVAAYELMEALSPRTEREAAFLIRAVPLVLDRVPRHRERIVTKEIIGIAEATGVILSSPVVLAVLSTLYEDVRGSITSIGRSLLKPSRTFTTEDAYNALSDLRHIEFAALGHGIVDDGPFALCTNDRAMALFWCALSVRGEATEHSLLNLNITFSGALFPRLAEHEIAQLRRLLLQ